MMTKLLLILMMVGLWSGCGEEIKVWKEEYSKDKVKEEYQYYHHPDNNRRIKDGWYNSYYPNGEYWEVGKYKDNKREGEWIYFTEDGKETKGIYDNGKKDSGEFWINVKKDSLGIFVETKDELWEDDEDGSKNVFRGLFTYEDGLWNGLGVLYWKNGNKSGEGLYKDGSLEGKFVVYYESGEVFDEDIWKDDVCVEMCEGDE